MPQRVQPADSRLSWRDILGYQPPAEVQTSGRDRRSKISPDECFDGIGVDYPPLNPDASCSAGVPAASQAHVWGPAQAGPGDPSFTGDAIWFGTVANPLRTGAAGIGSPEPPLTVSWVCEYGQSMLAHRLTDRKSDDPDFATTVGMRSAGSIGSIVFLAGPNMRGRVVFAAWNAQCGTCVGSCRATSLKNFRQWIGVNGVLYAGAASPSECCGFEIVGVLPDLPAYLANDDGKRLSASVWSDSQRETQARPTSQHGGGLYSAGICIRPPFGEDGACTSPTGDGSCSG